MHPALDIEQKVRAYLDGQLRRDDLLTWYRANRASLLSLNPDTDAAELATALELALIEMREDDALTNHQLSRQLKAMLRNLLGSTAHFAQDDITVLTASSSPSVSGDASTLAGEVTAGTAVTSHRLLPTGT